MIQKHFIDQSLKTIADQVNKNNNHLNTIDKIAVLLPYLTLMTREFESEMSKIITIIQYARLNHVHPYLLSPKMLEGNVKNIQNLLHGNIKFPEYNNQIDIDFIYKAANKIDKTLLFTIQIPIVNDNYYLLEQKAREWHTGRLF